MASETAPIPAVQQEKIQWNSPVLIGSILVAMVVFVLWVALFLLPKLGEDKSSQGPGPKINPIGVPVDQAKTTSEMGALVSDSQQNSMLVVSNLRTTHTGFLANKTQLETSNPSDIALVLELKQPVGATGVSFSFTRAELPLLRYVVVTREGAIPGDLDDLVPEDGISITRVKNLLTSDEPDEIVIEITKPIEP